MARMTESALLYAYLRERFPNARKNIHVRLGNIPNMDIPGLDPETARRMGMPSLPEIDAIVIDGGQVYLIECKIAKEWENLGKMLIYKHLLPLTPGWEQVDMNSVKLLMVLGRATPLLKNTAAAMDVLIDVYNTPESTDILMSGYPSQQG